MLDVRLIILFGIILFMIGCTAQPEQTIVDMPTDITGDVVDVPIEPPLIPEPIEEPVIVPIEPPVPVPEEPLVNLENGVSGLPKGTAGWAVDEAFPSALGWANDSELFGIKGYNLFDGKIRDTYDRVSDLKVYQGYYVVSFTAGSKEYREILDITVNWEGASTRMVKRFLPEAYAEGYMIVDWMLDSDDVAQVLESVKVGAGYSMPRFGLQPAGFIEVTLGQNRDIMTTPKGDIAKSEVYQGLDPKIPVCTATAYYEVAYDIDCTSGNIIGYWANDN